METSRVHDSSGQSNYTSPENLVQPERLPVFFCIPLPLFISDRECVRMTATAKEEGTRGLEFAMTSPALREGREGLIHISGLEHNNARVLISITSAGHA